MNRSYLIANESCDISGKEKLSIVLLYVRDKKKTVESFAGLVDNFLKHIRHIGVDLKKRAGQAYDGASTMAGHVGGV